MSNDDIKESIEDIAKERATKKGQFTKTANQIDEILSVPGLGHSKIDKNVVNRLLKNIFKHIKALENCQNRWIDMKIREMSAE